MYAVVPESAQMASILSLRLNECIIGKAGVAETLNRGAAEVQELMARAGARPGGCPTSSDRRDARARTAATLELPALGFGGGSLFGVRGEADATRLAGYAFDRGFRYFDTAPLYARGLGEHFLGTALRRMPRDEVIVSTKVGRRLRPRCASPAPDDGLPFETFYDYSYDGALRSLDDSLQRLGMPRRPRARPRRQPALARRRLRAPFHRGDGRGVRALERLRGEGVVRAIGVGVKGADVCLRFAQAGDFDCFMLAGGYTLLEHAGLDAFLPHCEANGIAVIVASPFNSGILATGAVEGARYSTNRRRTT